MRANNPEDILRDIRLPVGPMGEGDHRLVMYDTYQPDGRGGSYVGYRLFDGAQNLIFSGEDYSPGPMCALDSDESVAGLLGFLSCRKGWDTDDEYFADYTGTQLDYADTYGEELSLYATDEHEYHPGFLDW